ncbi:hypothetical protein M2306_000998 [Myroides gitamensis]|nr:hypothetical protein [Myroides gitamensis]
MKNKIKKISVLLFLLGLVSCSSDDAYEPITDNPVLDLTIPTGFPELNAAFF